MPIRRALATLVLLTVWHSLALAAPTMFRGLVVGLSDGDTLSVLREGQAVKVRVYGIDAPEKKQPFGTQAQQFASAAAFHKTVAVAVHTIDRYGRFVAEVFTPDGGNLGQALVGAGLAWWYHQFAPKDRMLAILEAEARAAKRGLWSVADPVPPWTWRKTKGKPVVCP